MRTWALALLLGCTPDTSSAPAETTPAPGETGSSPTDTAPPTASTGDTGAPPWAVEVDCSQLLPLPLEYEVLDWVKPAEDFTFDDEGYLVSVSGGNLERTPWGGPAELLVPNLGDVRGTRFLPDDTLALAMMEENAVWNVDPADGGREVLAASLTNPNGIAIGADGRVYVATTGQILRIDPALQLVDVVADMPGHSFDGITLSEDYDRVYFNEETGRVHFVDLAPDGTPSAPVLGAQIPIGVFSLLDGMAVDACGNLYVTEMGGAIWRVSPDGEVEVAAEITETLSFVPALNFGTGLGGFEVTTLYVMDFKGKLYAMEVGVPGKWEPHL